MSKFKNRMIFDVLLTVMLVFEMFYQFTGNTLHEIVGFAFFACIVAHLVFARRWIGSTASMLGKGKLNRHRKGLAIVAILLLVDIIVLGVSSLIISNTLWNLGINLSALNPGAIWYPLHTASAYVLCGLVLGHLAMHWSSVASVLKIQYDPARRRAIGQCVGAAVGVGAVALGVVGVSQVGKSASAVVATALGEEYMEGSTAKTESVAGEGAASGDSGAAANAESGAGEGAASGNSGSSANAEGVTGEGTTSGNSGLDAYSESGAHEGRGHRHGHGGGKHGGQGQGQGNGKGQGLGQGQGRGSSNGSSSDGVSGGSSGGESSNGESSNNDSSNGDSSNGSSSSGNTVSGICPLCPKQCSLSNPRCDRPYEEGLL